ERSRVQEVPLERRPLLFSVAAAQLARRSIESVADHWVSQRCQMHADLMGSPGGDLDLQERELSPGSLQPIYDAVPGERGASAGSFRGHARPADAIPRDRVLDRPRIAL